MSFCGLIKEISPKICILCVRVKINKRSFEPFSVWILFYSSIFLRAFSQTDCSTGSTGTQYPFPAFLTSHDVLGAGSIFHPPVRRHGTSCSNCTLRADTGEADLKKMTVSAWLNLSPSALLFARIASATPIPWRGNG